MNDSFRVHGEIVLIALWKKPCGLKDAAVVVAKLRIAWTPQQLCGMNKLFIIYRHDCTGKH